MTNANDRAPVLAAKSLPVAEGPFALSVRTGLVIVDVINGFATVGAGPLAPPRPDARIARVIDETNRLAREFCNRHLPIAVFIDTHVPGTPEPPYPLHCEAGSGEDELVDALKWLEACEDATLIRKDCIDGFIGAYDPATGENAIVRWVGGNELDAVVVVGLCTDICVMDFVLSMLSARNHRLMPTLRDIVVFEPACATYDLPGEAVVALGLPETAVHPQTLTHHLGLYMMATRGAIIANAIE
jgi:nicotinamidase-related amidase